MKPEGSDRGASMNTVVIRNALIFDGRSDRLSRPSSVLVRGNKIAAISEAGIELDGDAMVIDAMGRVMTPGFLDSHAHVMLQMTPAEGATSDELYFAYVATETARTYLAHGFTTIRDAAGNTFSLKKAIDRGIVAGPRIYPSGPMLSQTAGHSDHRTDAERSAMVANEQSVLMKYDMVQIADGRPEVLKAVRENLRRGASQIKIAVGGGVASFADPLDVTEYTPDEIRAAVEAAADWGTYVMSHVYNDKGIRRAIDSGVRSIEHGNLVEEATLRLMKEKGIWLSPQVLVFADTPKGLTEDQMKKHAEAFAGIDHMFRLVKKIGFEKIAFGSDIVTDPAMVERINNEFQLRAKWFTPAEILRQATSNSAELLGLSGLRNPYPGKLGVIAVGAYADLLLVDGNPLEDISVLTKPEEKLALIMKDGVIHKNTIPESSERARKRPSVPERPRGEALHARQHAGQHR